MLFLTLGGQLHHTLIKQRPLALLNQGMKKISLESSLCILVSMIGIFSLSYRKSETSVSEACLLGGIASLSQSTRRSLYSKVGWRLYVLERRLRADEEKGVVQDRGVVLMVGRDRNYMGY